jgi:serine/threonine-protein kinase
MAAINTTDPLVLRQDPLVGTRLGEYEVLEPVGEGGMGVVYRGIHPLIKKQVAIKVLKPVASTDAAHVKRLLAEAEAVNAIRHRNIIDIFGMGQLPDGRPYVVMEYLEGEGLDVYLRANASLSLHHILRLLVEIATPLAAAHDKGVIHRDLKPSNVFLCRQADGTQFLKLLDFGLAKRAAVGHNSTAQTSQTVVAGTPDYMAPEQARGMAVSARTDIYSFGAMAFEMLTGDVPYRGQTPMDVMMAHVSAPVVSALDRRPSLPPQIDNLVKRLMAKDPDDRPATMSEVRTELVEIISSLSIEDSSYRPLLNAAHLSTESRTPVIKMQVVPAKALRASGRPRAPWVVAGVLASVVLLGLLIQRASSQSEETPLSGSDQVQAPPPMAAIPAVVMPQSSTVNESSSLRDATSEGTSPTVWERSNPSLPSIEEPSASAPDKTKVIRRPPSAEQIRARIDTIRERLVRLTPKGEPLDVASEKLLSGYKLKSYAAQSAADLFALEKKLLAFERDVLGPMRK